MRISSDQTDDRAAKAAATVDLSRLGPAAPAAQEAEDDLVPARDLLATRVEDVYRVESLLTKGELVALGAAGASLLQEYSTPAMLREAQKEKLLSSLGVGLLEKELAASTPDLAQAGLVLYLEGLVKFSRLRAGDLRKGGRALQPFLPVGVKQKIVDTFSELSGSDRLRWLQVWTW